VEAEGTAGMDGCRNDGSDHGDDEEPPLAAVPK
jgi:hypothetical protein